MKLADYREEALNFKNSLDICIKDDCLIYH